MYSVHNKITQRLSDKQDIVKNRKITDKQLDIVSKYDTTQSTKVLYLQTDTIQAHEK